MYAQFGNVADTPSPATQGAYGAS